MNLFKLWEMLVAAQVRLATVYVAQVVTIYYVLKYKVWFFVRLSSFNFSKIFIPIFQTDKLLIF